MVIEILEAVQNGNRAVAVAVITRRTVLSKIKKANIMQNNRPRLNTEGISYIIVKKKKLMRKGMPI